MSEITTKQIGELPSASAVGADDLFVIEQGGVAKKAQGSTIKTLAGGGFSSEAKGALLALLQKVAYTDTDAQDLYDDLETALYSNVVLVSISAVFTQGAAVIYDTDSLDTLKQYLVVTASYNDGTSRTVTNYTLSGNLTAGTSTITVAYSGMETTFTVTVTERNPSLYNWDFTTSLVDTKQGATATLSGSPTQDSNGITFTALAQCISLGSVLERGRAIEIDFTTFDMKKDTTYNKRLLMYGSATNTTTGILINRKTSDVWSCYTGSWGTSFGIAGGTAFANSTVRVEVSSTGVMSLYKNGTLIGDSDTKVFPDTLQNIYIGNTGTSNDGADIHDCTVTGVRIYEVAE